MMTAVPSTHVCLALTTCIPQQSSLSSLDIISPTSPLFALCSLEGDTHNQINRSVFYSLPTLLLHTYDTVTFIWKCNIFFVVLYYRIIHCILIALLYVVFYCVIYDTCIGLGYSAIFSNPAVQLFSCKYVTIKLS